MSRYISFAMLVFVINLLISCNENTTELFKGRRSDCIHYFGHAGGRVLLDGGLPGGVGREGRRHRRRLPPTAHRHRMYPTIMWPTVILWPPL